MIDPLQQNVQAEAQASASRLCGTLDAVLILGTMRQGDEDIFLDVRRGSGYATYALAKEFCIRWEQQVRDQATSESQSESDEEGD